MSTTEETINDTEADAARALVELLADPRVRDHRHRRFVLIRRATGELEFEQEEIEAIFDEVFAEACGRPKPRRRVIKLDRPRTRRRSSKGHSGHDRRSSPREPVD